MKVTRTSKEFSREKMPLDFLRRTLSIAGLHKAPLKFELEDFIIEEHYRAESDKGTISPWEVLMVHVKKLL